MTISVLIASRIEIYAEGIKKLLEDDERLCLCGIACTQEDFAEMLKTGPNVVVADQTIVSNSVIPSASKLLLIYDRPSFSVNATNLQGLIAKGLAGILVNNSNSQMLRKAIGAVAAGQLWLDHKTINFMLCQADGKESDAQLTKKEAEVRHYLCAGLSNKEIAEKLFISEQTVKSHCNHIYKKSGVKNRLQLMVSPSERNGVFNWSPQE